MGYQTFYGDNLKARTRREWAEARGRRFGEAMLAAMLAGTAKRRRRLAKEEINGDKANGGGTGGNGNPAERVAEA